MPDSPTNRTVAEAIARKIELEYLTGQFDPTLERYKPKGYQVEGLKTDLTIQELWQRYAEARHKSVSPSTFKNTYLVMGSHLIRCPYQNLKDAIAIQDWAIANLTQDTARRFLQQLGAACKWGAKRALCSGNPFEGMTGELGKRKAKRKIDPFSQEEKLAILSAFHGHAREPLIKFLFLTGCRTGEAIALKWKHCTPDCSEIEFCENVVLAKGGAVRKTSTKGGGSRRFPCNSRLQELLKEIKPAGAKGEDSIFNCSHQQLRDAWGEVVKPLVEVGKLKRWRSQYNTRHTFCSEMLERGISPAQVAEWVGNSTEMVVRHYAGIVAKIAVPEI